jgi:hypothetical protein
VAAVRLLGFFNRLADAACLAALRAEPAIVGLTESLVGLSAGGAADKAANLER